MGPATKRRYPPYREWWATKTRYPPYINQDKFKMGPATTLIKINLRWGRQQKHVTHPTLIKINLKWGRQQKHVTHPTLIKINYKR